MKIIVKHPSGLEYKSKSLDYTKIKLFNLIEKSEYFLLEGEEYEYILMKDFLKESVIVILEQ